MAQCTANTSGSGNRCKKGAIKGGTVCATHGGSAPQVKAAAQRRYALSEARGLVEAYGTELDVEPEEAIFSMIRVTAGNVILLQDLVAQLEPKLGPDGIAGRTGNERVTNEAKPHVLVSMYNEERDRLVRFSKVAAEIGLSDRMVRLAESQAEMLVKIITAIIDDPELALSGEQRKAGRSVAARHLRAV